MAASPGSIGSLASAGSSSGEETSEEYIINSSDQLSCSSLELEDIQEAIVGVRRTILETEERSEARKELVHRLIRLRIRAEDLRHRHTFLLPGQLESRGHSFLPAEPSPRPAYCQQCAAPAWPPLQTVHCCRTCGHTVHGACLADLARPCVGSFLQGEEAITGPHYDGQLAIAICPELSLAEQDYQCAECGASLLPGQARLCDYTGQSYCTSCHWGRASPSPARVLANWDFSPRPMAEASLQYLALTNRRPLIHLARAAPGLAAVTEEVAAVAGQRHHLLAMKKYLLVCRVAQEERLLTRLKERQHMVDGRNMYSFQDLRDLQAGALHSYLDLVLAAWRDHITACVLCQAKGFLCELCNARDTIFPFSPLVEECQACEAVFHRDCLRSVAACPRCERKKELRERRTETSPEPTEDS